MRYIYLILTGILLSSYSVTLFAQAKEKQQEAYPAVTLDRQQVSLAEILVALEKQSGYSFSYDPSVIESLPKVSLTVKELPLDKCLDQLFTKLPVMYQRSGRVIILKKKPRQVVISGFVRDRASSESLIGASVYHLSDRKGTASNSYGFFSLSLDPGDIQLQISYIGYRPTLLSFPFMERDTMLTIELESNAALQEVVVYGSDQNKQPVLTTQMGAMEINQKTIKQMPVMFGEADIIKTLQMTPGVAAGTEGTAGMYVRGGNMDENLFLIDGNPVYQVNHVGGIFSAFNPEAIRGMDFLKGGFPARYGGRLSSVVDVHTKEGNMKEYHGSASIGLISGNLALEGPIMKDRTSFMVSMRHTWLDVLTIPTLAIVNGMEKKHGSKVRGRYAFYDLNAKINHRFSDRSRLFLSFYHGNDKLKGGNTEFNPDKGETPYTYDEDARLSWGNLMGTVGWTYVFNNKLFGKVAGVFTQYRSSMERITDNVYSKKGDAEYSAYYNATKSVSGIMDMGVRTSFDYLPATAHHVRFGGDVMVHRFRPEYSRMDAVTNDTTRMGNVFADDKMWAREISLFAEDDWTLSPTIRLNGGLRFSMFNIDGKTFIGAEPRLSMRWLLRKDLSLKASYARMRQHVHLIHNSYLSLPTDAWMPVTSRLKPLTSDQLSAGIYYNLKGGYDISLEGYYKHFRNLLEFKDGYSFLPTFTDWESKLTAGTGRSYGAEVMIRKPEGRLNGWVGYTLSWSDRNFREVNEGERFPSRFDNRHKLNVIAMYKLSPRVELSAAWTYTSGNRMTLSLESYEGIGENDYMHDYPSYGSEIDYIGKRNNYRMPAYHRLDLGINIYRPKRNGRMGIWNISIYNVYNRLNPFLVYKSSKEVPVWVPPVENPSYPEYGSGYGGYYNKTKSVPVFKKIGVMPIIPSISYTYKF